MTKALCVISAVIIIFCASSFIAAQYLNQRAEDEGYGMGAGGTPYDPTVQKSITEVKTLNEINCNIAGMPREMFDKYYPVPSNVLIDSITINTYHDNELV